MQPVNYNHTSCPKCSATISSGSKTCSSCGAVSSLSSFRFLTNWNLSSSHQLTTWT
ncbi:hypothetical protein V8C42DRAFT_333563 [Trichoderma barbatum]